MLYVHCTIWLLFEKQLAHKVYRTDLKCIKQGAHALLSYVATYVPVYSSNMQMLVVTDSSSSLVMLSSYVYLEVVPVLEKAIYYTDTCT